MQPGHDAPPPASGITIVGSYLAPYVRKVLVCLELKALPYRVEPIVPFYGNDDFARLSPLRRVPVPIDDRVTLADSLLGEALIWHLFNQVVIRRFVWGEAPDEQVLRKAREHEIPHALDYLESRLPAEGCLFGAIGVADVALAAFFRNAEMVRYEIDAARWPICAVYVARVLGHAAFARLRAPSALRGSVGTHAHRAASGGVVGSRRARQRTQLWHHRAAPRRAPDLTLSAALLREPVMCRNIKTLFNFEPPACELEIRDASLQFVRKLSGFTRPSKANEAAFHRAVEQVAAAARSLIGELVTSAAPRDRAVQAARARATAQRRYPDTGKAG